MSYKYLLPFVFLPVVASASSLDARTQVPAMPADHSVETTLECVARNRLSGDYAANVNLVRQGAKASRQVLQGKVLYRATPDERWMRFVVTGPSPEAGTTFLVNQTVDRLDVFVHQPGLNKTVQFGRSKYKDSLLGTSLSLADIDNVLHGLGLPWMDYAGKVDGRAVSRVNFAPRPERRNDFDQLRTWIDQRTCLPVRMEMKKSAGRSVLVRLDPERVERRNGGWITTSLTVSGAEPGETYEVSLEGVRNDLRLPGAAFRRGSFHIGAY